MRAAATAPSATVSLAATVIAGRSAKDILRCASTQPASGSGTCAQEHQLARPERCLVGAGQKSSISIRRACAPPRADAEGAAGREQEGRGVGVGVGEAEVAADRADVSHAQVSDAAFHRRERRACSSRTSGERSSSRCVVRRADAQLAVAVSIPRELLDPP